MVKTVFLLTNNLHGRTRRRRENTKAEARGAKGAAARHARPTHAGAGRDVGLRGRRCRSPKRRGGRSGYSWKATRVAPTPQGCMWTRLGARHRGHLLFAARCMAASQPRQTACGQCQRHGGARDCGSCVGHGSSVCLSVCAGSNERRILDPRAGQSTYIHTTVECRRLTASQHVYSHGISSVAHPIACARPFPIFFWLNRLLTHEQPTRTDEVTTGKIPRQRRVAKGAAARRARPTHAGAG